MTTSNFTIYYIF